MPQINSHESMNGKGADFNSPTTRIVGGWEATEILDRKVNELLTDVRLKGGALSHSDAVMKAVKLLEYCEVKGSFGQQYSIICDPVEFAEEKSGGGIVNRAGEPVKASKEMMQEATMLVDRYNEIAGELAQVVQRLVELRTQMNDDVGMGNVIISGDGMWTGNALEMIPMLKMFNGEFPSAPVVGSYYRKSSPTDQMHYAKPEEFSENLPIGKRGETIRTKAATAFELTNSIRGQLAYINRAMRAIKERMDSH